MSATAITYQMPDAGTLILKAAVEPKNVSAPGAREPIGTNPAKISDPSSIAKTKILIDRQNQKRYITVTRRFSTTQQEHVGLFPLMG